MKQVTKTAFRDMPSVELGRDGVLEVVSHGTVVGYWVPRDEWARIEAELVVAALRRGDVEYDSTPTSGRTTGTS